MKLAIVGTSIGLTEEQYKDVEQLCKDIMKISMSDDKDVTVISGGAESVDKIAEQSARKLGLDTKIHLPAQKNWESYKARNLKIVDECDVLYCITVPTKTEKCYHHKPVQDHQKTAGCWTLEMAKQAGKKCKLFVVGEK